MLKNLYRATRLIETHKDLLDKTNPVDLLALAEYYYSVNAINSAKAISTDFLVNIPYKDLPTSVSLRIMFLGAAIDNSPKKYISRVAYLLHISHDDAEFRIREEINKLNSFRERNNRTADERKHN